MGRVAASPMHRSEEVRDSLLGLAVRCTRQRMGINFDIGHVAAQRRRGSGRKASGEGGFAGARRTDEKDNSVHGQEGLLQLRPGGEVQHGLRQKPVFQPRRQNDGFPDAVELGVVQRPDIKDALLVRRRAPGVSITGRTRFMRCLFDPIPPTMTLPWRGYLFDVTIYMGQLAYVHQI